MAATSDSGVPVPAYTSPTTISMTMNKNPKRTILDDCFMPISSNAANSAPIAEGVEVKIAHRG